jgi:hypothetical protein
MRQASLSRVGSLVERKIQRRIGYVKFRICGADFRWFDTEQVSIKFSALHHVFHENRNVGFLNSWHLGGHLILQGGAEYIYA